MAQRNVPGKLMTPLKLVVHTYRFLRSFTALNFVEWIYKLPAK
jgi:hypothetical protein